MGPAKGGRSILGDHWTLVQVVLMLVLLHVCVPSGSPGWYLDFRGRRKVDVIVTLDPVPSFDLDQWRRQVQALLGSVGASRPETAAAGYSDGAGDVPLQDPQLPPLRWVRDRDRREQGLGVGVLGIFEKLLGFGEFDNPTQVHHCRPVAHLPDYREVV